MSWCPVGCPAGGVLVALERNPGATATPVAPCPLTDGNLAQRLPAPVPATTTTGSPGAAVAPVPDTATIDLGRPAEVTLIVVRDCSCKVEGLVDGQAWTAVGRSSGSTALVRSRTGPARYVRVQGPLGPAGVSVWEGRRPRARAAGIGPGRCRAAAGSRRSGRASGAVAPEAGVRCLLALVAAAVGTAAGARITRSQ